MRAFRRMTPGKVFSYIFIVCALLLTALPLVWMLKTAFSFNRDLLENPTSPFPENFTFLNFKRVLGLASPEEMTLTGGIAKFDFVRYTLNSVIYMVTAVIGQVMFATIAGYVLARARFRGRNLLFSCFVAGMFVPAILLIIPNFLLVRDLGWIDTYAGIIVPSLLFAPFAVFFMRQYFLGFNGQVEEAARLDGLGLFGTLWRIVLPMSIPPMITLSIITAVAQWQDYFWPLLVGKSEQFRSLTVGLSVFNDQSRSLQVDWSGLMAASTITVLPIVIAVALVGKKIVGSIQFGGMK